MCDFFGCKYSLVKVVEQCTFEFGQVILESDDAWAPQNTVNTCSDSELQCNVCECGMEKQNSRRV